MSAIVRLHPSVPADLHSILSYISSYSPAAADRFAASIDPTLSDLAQMPGKGSLKQFRSRSLSGIRSWRVSGFANYLILYRPIPDGIYVIAIVHGARRLGSILKQRINPI